VIVSDLDGMLVTGPRFSEEFPKKFGVPRVDVDEFFSGEFQQCKIGELDLRNVLEKYAQKWGIGVAEILEFWFGLSTINKEVVEILKKLKAQDVSIILATNQEKYRLAYLLELLQEDEHWIDVVIASCEIGIKKPDPEFYERIESLFPIVKKNDMLVFDDKKETIEALIRMGYVAEVFEDVTQFKKSLKKFGLEFNDEE